MQKHIIVRFPKNSFVGVATPFWTLTFPPGGTNSDARQVAPGGPRILYLSIGDTLNHQGTAITLPRSTSATFVDLSGAGISFLCFLHCLAMPMVVVALPVVGALAEAEWMHKALVALAIPISGSAVFAEIKSGKATSFSILVVFGIILLFLAAFVAEFHSVEKQLTAIGALIVAGSHLRRWHAHRKLNLITGGKENAHET